MVYQLKDTELDDDHKESKALVGMIAFGAGEIIGGLLLGVIIDKIGSKYTCIINIMIVGVQGLVTILSINSADYNALSFLMTFLWGFQDGALNIHTFQILGFEFETQSEPFGVFNLVQGIGVAAV